jgi:mono/diheme cytochrome c family protein
VTTVLITRAVFVATTLALLVGCDESQVVHEPSFSLERMQEQPRLDPFDLSMGSPPSFTIARGFGATLPRPVVTRPLVLRGQSHFETICAACHGIRGDGDSVVASKMILRLPPSLLEPSVRALSDEQLSEIIARGYGLMPPYANALPEEDRWATVAYVRALQIAQGVDVKVLPAQLVADLTREAP